MANKTVLLIEDNVLNLKLVKTLLEFNKYAVVTAEDAEKGIQLARDLHPDLILMDLQLPGMDGLEATRRIKKDPDLEDIPIVALTSFAMEGDEERALSAGCNGYIPKPINTREFSKTIAQYHDPKGQEV
jgi:CheY-like chemotaxis protein